MSKLRLRRVEVQRGPSLGLDDHGDPLPVAWEVGYEIEHEPGYWTPIGEAEAARLLQAGEACLAR